MSSQGELILIPNVISENTEDEVLPASLRERIKHLKHFLVEDVRTARRYLSRFKIYESIESLKFSVLNKDTQESGLAEMMAPLANGESMGVISESGCPGVADPGALAVAYAHRHGIRVVPLVGPSSILLSLMASGLNGQNFAFHGYLPIDQDQASAAIKKLEKESSSRTQTQIFIETPYRNNQLVKKLTQSLGPSTLLCIALDVTGASESIRTKSVKEWKRELPELPKLPVVFLFQA